MEIIVTGVRTIASGKNKITEEIEYNILEGVASVYADDDEEPYEVSSELFTKDIKKVIRLAVKEIDFYKAKVDNNKIVISMSEGRELDKAIRHMAINQNKLDAINDFIKSVDKK
tara:strand:- start:5851 stop:6192 length:342 start_codon:yes stop_codon:yes gene_type:complete